MQVNDAVERIVAILKLNPLLNCAKVISQVERVTGWLNARENALHSCNSRMT
jgi:hypothetical protein